jgi:hypothetical protein
MKIKKLPVLVLVLATLFILISCTNYSDHKFLISKENKINLLSPSIDLCITGDQELNYRVTITTGDYLIDTLSIKSTREMSFTKAKLNFSNLKENLPLVIYRLVENPKLKITISAIGGNYKVRLDTTITLDIKIPPVSLVSILNENEYTPTSLVLLNSEKNELKLKKSIPNLNETKIKKTEVLSDMIIRNSYHPAVSISESDLPIHKITDKIKVSVLTDTLYEYSIIGRYPSKNNKIYSEIDIDKEIKKVIKNNLSSLKSDWLGKKNGNLFVLEDEINAEYEGLVGLFVININKDGLYSYQEVANFIVDDTAPEFENREYGTFRGDDRYEGLVCLSTENFYGFNPYKVPFIGQVYGDIKEIFVDGKRIPFTVGNDLYFKKSIYLDGGYNRISIKLVDLRGNSAEYFIPVSIKSLDINEINIDVENDN